MIDVSCSDLQKRHKNRIRIPHANCPFSGSPWNISIGYDCKTISKRTDFDECLYYEPDKRKGLLKGFFPVIKYNNNNYSDLTEIS